MLSALITDRTAADFQRWEELRDKGFQNMTEEERAEWQTDLKGAYNASDLNRVGIAMNYLRDRLTEAGYLKGTEFNLRIDWPYFEIPTHNEFKNYILAVGTIRNALAIYRTTPPAPTKYNSLNIEEANNIEKILIDVDELITKMQAQKYYCGEMFSGEIKGV